jgi:hypothetical protein
MLSEGDGGSWSWGLAAPLSFLFPGSAVHDFSITEFRLLWRTRGKGLVGLDDNMEEREARVIRTLIIVLVLP